MGESLSRQTMRAVFAGDVERFESLVDQGLDLHTVAEPDHWNLLHRALISGANRPVPRMIEHLIRRDVGVNDIDRYGNAPLHYAARWKDPELLRMLLDAGARVDPVNIDGLTPLRLMLSLKPVVLPAVDVLLAHGANVEQQIPGGATILDYARSVMHGEERPVVGLLERYRKRKDST